MQEEQMIRFLTILFLTKLYYLTVSNAMSFNIQLLNERKQSLLDIHVYSHGIFSLIIGVKG